MTRRATTSITPIDILDQRFGEARAAQAATLAAAREEGRRRTEEANRQQRAERATYDQLFAQVRPMLEAAGYEAVYFTLVGAQGYLVTLVPWARPPKDRMRYLRMMEDGPEERTWAHDYDGRWIPPTDDAYASAISAMRALLAASSDVHGWTPFPAKAPWTHPFLRLWAWVCGGF